MFFTPWLGRRKVFPPLEKDLLARSFHVLAIVFLAVRCV